MYIHMVIRLVKVFIVGAREIVGFPYLVSYSKFTVSIELVKKDCYVTSRLQFTVVSFMQSSY